jgi:hypothetical protein
MTALDPPPRDVPKSLTDDATAAAPRIVNGLTVRPREKVNLWGYFGAFGIALLPDIAVFLLIVGLGMRRLLRYLDAKGGRPAVSDGRMRPR